MKRFDWFDVGLSTANPFGKFGAAGSQFANETANSLVDFKDGKFKVALYNKDASHVMIDFGIGQLKVMRKTTLGILGGANPMRDHIIDVGAGIYKTEVKKAISE